MARAATIRPAQGRGLDLERLHHVARRAGPARRRAGGHSFSHQSRTPFWACRRFSARSHNTDCGPSITEEATSSLAMAGQAVHEWIASRLAQRHQGRSSTCIWVAEGCAGKGGVACPRIEDPGVRCPCSSPGGIRRLAGSRPTLTGGAPGGASPVHIVRARRAAAPGRRGAARSRTAPPPGSSCAPRLLPSPVQATLAPAIGPFFSSKVSTSAISWQGWLESVRPLITGTVAASAISVSRSSPAVRIMIASTRSATAPWRCRRWSRRGRSWMSFAGQHDRLAAQLAHANLEADPGPGRRLLEDQRQGLAGERPGLRAARIVALEPRGGVSACPASSPLSTWWRSRKCRGSGMRDLEAPAHLLQRLGPPPRSPRRRSPAAAAGGPTLSAAGAPSMPCIAHPGDEVAGRRSDLKADHQTGPAHLPDRLRMASGEVLQPLPQPAGKRRGPCRGSRAPAARRATAFADRHGQRVAAISAAVAAGGHALGGLFGRHEGTQRESPSRCPWPRTSRPARSRPIHGRRTGRSGRSRTGSRPDRAADRIRRRSPAARGDSSRSALRIPPSPWIGSTCRAAVSSVMAARSSFRLPNGTWSKPLHHRAEALDQLGRLGGGDAGQRPAVEGALDRDDPPPLGLADRGEVLADQLDPRPPRPRRRNWRRTPCRRRSPRPAGRPAAPPPGMR